MAIMRRSPVGGGSVFDDEFGVGAAGDPTVLNQNPDPGGPASFELPPDPTEVPDAPPPPVVQPERSGETGRDRASSGSGGGGTGSPGLTGGVAAPPRPRVPTPQAGTPMQPPVATPPPSINAPLPKLMSSRRSLLGGAGGLTMGGLGVPFDPTSNQKSDPISTLMELLGKKQVF